MVFGSGQKLLLLQTLLSKTNDTSESTTIKKKKKGATQICCFGEDNIEQVVNPAGMLPLWMTDR